MQRTYLKSSSSGTVGNRGASSRPSNANLRWREENRAQPDLSDEETNIRNDQPLPVFFRCSHSFSISIMKSVEKLTKPSYPFLRVLEKKKSGANVHISHS